MTRLEHAALFKDRTDPYHALVAAILHQAVVDAHSVRYRAEAEAFLQDPEAVGYLCALVGCDSVQPALLQAAGLRGTAA